GLPSLTDIVTFTWTFTNTNRLPEVVIPGDQFNLPGDSVSLQIEARDPDGDELTYAATGLPDALSINPATSVISGTVTIESLGANAVEVVISDGQDNVTIDFAGDVEYSELFLPIIWRE
ncbi:MAG: putative Ig domain-containing protein, partial [Anaerolineales bacterium]